MKPLCKDSYIDQALANGKGVTWLDDCRIPYTDDSEHYSKKGVFGFRNYSSRHRYDRIVNGEMDRTVSTNIKGRFPANLLCQDDVLNDGRLITSTGGLGVKVGMRNDVYGNYKQGIHSASNNLYHDSGSYSRYFDLDKWFETTFPFCIVSKASPTEREKGLDSYEPAKVNDGRQAPHDTPHLRAEKIRHNTHPTIKPIKLMAWLITLGSRPGDIILDPFAGSGTTCIAAQMLKRNFIGIEIDKDFAEIARARLKAWNTEKIL
jgi:site-specific DNA-methyltransferase (adenine-specific)